MIIRCEHKTMNLEAGLSVMECLRTLAVDTQGVLAVQQGGRVLELTDVITREGEIRPLTLRDEEGRRIYERSLRFVALLAFRRLMPGQRVRIEYSVGGGVFMHTPGRVLSETDVKDVHAEMQRIVQADLPFDKREWSLDDAIAYFEADGQPDKVALLRRRTVPFFMMYECGGMWEYFYGAMAPSTGYVRVFGAQHLPGRGMAILTPDPENPACHAAYIDRPQFKTRSVIIPTSELTSIFFLHSGIPRHQPIQQGRI